ncbi:DsbA family oxidoreductase [uncultured Brevibacterium sp.]|uniref:DsbA family oxidoreductase n=1 Tax=uncultured Brevibacterium sp. TaxID=189678 RepID=UPI003458CE26
MTIRIDIWSDIACPWCRIGKARFESALARFAHRDEVEVAWHAFILDPDLPVRYDGTEVEYLIERKGMPRAQVEAMTQQIARAGAGEGLDFDFDSVVPSSSLAAHALLKYAEATGADVGAVEDALFDAHFRDGEVIADADVLVRIGAAQRLDAGAVRAGLTDPTVVRAVQADLAAAQQIGVSGVPFFVFEQKYGVSGAQPSEVFTQALEQVWAEVHPQVGLTPLGEPDAAACGPDGCAVPTRPDAGAEQS